MKRSAIGAVLALSLALGSPLAGQSMQPTGPEQAPHSWPAEPRWQGPGPMPRHYIAALWGIPAPYAEMVNPQKDRRTILERGAAVYARNCLSCHGRNGVGDGEAGRGLSPPPGNLVWLSDVPRKQWDAYMYWTVAEGGGALGTGMPAYKDKLAADDVWAVIAYVQAYLPFDSSWR